MKLFIVESPGKVKKIQSFLGDEFKVTASVGHIRQLKKDDYFDETTFTPKYDIIEDKEKVVKELRSLAKASTMVYLCADLDREGEAIAESCRDLLNLKTNDYERVTFNEITKAAILDALKKPRKMDVNLVNAQVSRALLDQIVGFKLTQQLYKRISKAKLSVGRVQTVAVRLVADKEDEVLDFLDSNKGSFYNVNGNFNATNIYNNDILINFNSYAIKSDIDEQFLLYPTLIYTSNTYQTITSFNSSIANYTKTGLDLNYLNVNSGGKVNGLTTFSNLNSKFGPGLYVSPNPSCSSGNNKSENKN